MFLYQNHQDNHPRIETYMNPFPCHIANPFMPPKSRFWHLCHSYEFKAGFLRPFPPKESHVESILNRNIHRVNSYTAHFPDSWTMAAAGLLHAHWPGRSQTKLGLASFQYGQCVLQVALTSSLAYMFGSTSLLEVAFDPCGCCCCC